jgi:hypothetical protein
MATGDVPNVLARLRAVLPPWFPAVAPVLNGLLSGFATNASWLYSLYQFAQAQTRIRTASGAWLDLVAWDYFGPTFTRRLGESDASFQSRILTFLLLPRNTVSGITRMLIALTGRTPSIIEPAIGTGGWDQATAFAFDNAGCWSGSTLSITAFRPPGQGVPGVDGFDGSIGGFDSGAVEWADLGQITGQVTDAEITMRVRQWVAAGVNYTLTITS